jgi:hypothetical protein
LPNTFLDEALLVVDCAIRITAKGGRIGTRRRRISSRGFTIGEFGPPLLYLRPFYRSCNEMALINRSYKRDMWQMIATELVMPWRAVEAMGWQMGVEEMNARANERVFQTHPSTSRPRSPPPSTPGSSGGEASAPLQQQVGVGRNRRSLSAASNRRRAQSDAVSRNEKTAQLSALPVVSEAAANEDTRPATTATLAPTAADELYATPSPPPSYRRPSMEGSSAGNPPTPQRDVDHRRSGSLASSAGPARDQAAQPKTEDRST